MENYDVIIKKWYKKLLLREPDSEGYEYFSSLFREAKINEEDFKNEIKKSDEDKKINIKINDVDINCFEKSINSQNGEDGIINFIFSVIGTTNKFSVEIGCDNGEQCNTRFLLENGWTGILIDNFSYQKNFQWIDPVSKPRKKFLMGGNFGIIKSLIPYFKKEFVTMENINNILEKNNTPTQIDLLSIDIDYNTFWIWKAINKIRPRVVIIEYNSQISHTESKVVKYDPGYKYDWTNYFGGSLLAFVKLAKEKGYSLVGCDSSGINAIFIDNDEIKKKKIKIKSVEENYRSPQFGDVWDGVPKGWPISNKNMDEY